MNEELEKVFKELHLYKAQVYFGSEYNEKTREFEYHYSVRVYNFCVGGKTLGECVKNIEKYLKQRELDERRNERHEQGDYEHDDDEDEDE